jgi:hypothetical protein
VARVIIFLIIVALIGGTISCAPAPTSQYDLTIVSTEGGSVTTPGEATFTYDEGEVVDLIAEADEGYEFVNWTGDVDDIDDVEDASTTITIKDDYSITATFAVKQYSLIVRSTEGGSVTTPGEDAYTYEKGEVVTLAAVANEGYQFIDWTGDVGTVADTNAASTTITMNGGYSITANFAGAIRDWYALDAVRDNLDGSYILVIDLDSTTAGYTELASPTANQGKGWEPIGRLTVDPVQDYSINPIEVFSGSLDGQGYEIRDVFISRLDEDGIGLFGSVGEGGVIENLGVMNVAVTGRSDVGGLVGFASWDSTVSNSSSSGSVIGSGYVGGLVGQNWGSVTDSYSTGSVTGSDLWIGGLVGGNSGTVTNSYSTGSIAGNGHVGGLAGGNWGSVSNSYSSGGVTGNGPVGGLVGFNHMGTVSNSYSTGSITGEGNVGGLVGEHHDGTVSNSYYSYDQVLINGRKVITIGAVFGKDFEQWLANDKSLEVNGMLSEENGYYLINDVNDFKSLLVFGQNGALKFRLTNDLDLGGESNFYIPYLAGEFDGNSHRIANLNLNCNFISQVALFGYLASGGKVTGVSAENVNITGGGIVGSLVGENDGTVSNSHSTGRVTGYWCVGGLVGCIGWHKGAVTNSYYNYNEFFINDSRRIITIGALSNEDFHQWLTSGKFLDINERLSQEDGYYLINNVGDLKQLLAFGQNGTLKFRLANDLDLGTTANFYIPYLAGEFDGNGHRISNLTLNCNSIGQVGLFGYLASGGRITQVHVENMNVTGAWQVGGLVGGSDGTVSNSYSTGSVTGDNTVGGLVGRNGGTLDNSYSTASVTGSATWSVDVGGLAGGNWGTLSNSYSTGSVIGNWRVGGLAGGNWHTVSNSYSTGSVTAVLDVGGLLGANWGTVSNCFWDAETSGQATSAGGTVKTTAEMQDIATFSGAAWDICAVNPGETNRTYTWNIVDGETYPFLSWQSVF